MNSLIVVATLLLASLRRQHYWHTFLINNIQVDSTTARETCGRGRRNKDDSKSHSTAQSEMPSSCGWEHCKRIGTSQCCHLLFFKNSYWLSPPLYWNSKLFELFNLSSNKANKSTSKKVGKKSNNHNLKILANWQRWCNTQLKRLR